MIRQLAYGCGEHVTVLALAVTMRTLAVGRPGFCRAADAGAAESEPGVASEDRPGLAVAQLQSNQPADGDAERVAPLRRDHRDTRATTQRERPHRDYSVPSAGRRSGSPSRGNWSSWNVTISVIAPPVMRRTSIVSGR